MGMSRTSLYYSSDHLGYAGAASLTYSACRDQIIQIAKEHQAQTIIPGYGFRSQFRYVPAGYFCGFVSSLAKLIKSNTDYAAANAVVECTHRYKKLFYDAGED